MRRSRSRPAEAPRARRIDRRLTRQRATRQQLAGTKIKERQAETTSRSTTRRSLETGTRLCAEDSRAFPIDGPGNERATTATSTSWVCRTDGYTRLLRRLGHGLEGPADPRQPDETKTIGGRDYLALLGRRPPAAGRLEDRPGLLLDRQHPAQRARPRVRCSGSPSRCRSTRADRDAAQARDHQRDERERPIGVIGVGWVGPRDGRLLRRARAAGGRDATSTPAKVERSAAGARCRSTSRASPSSLERTPSGSHFTTEMADVLEGARLLFCCVDTPPTYSGDADLSRVAGAWSRELGDGEHALVMKSTVPVGTGPRDPAATRRTSAYVSCPEFLKEGTAVEDFLQPGSRRGRRRPAATSGPPTASRRSTRRSAARSSAPTSPQRGDDQARLQRLPRHEDLASSTRSRTSARRSARTSPRSRAAWASTSGSARSFLRAGHRLRRLAASRRTSQALKQLAGNSGYHFQLLTAVIEVNELQKRRVIGEARRSTSARWSARRSRCSGLAFKPDTDDMREATSLVLAARLAGRGRERARLRPGGRATARRELLPASRSPTRRSRRSRAPTRRCS